MSSIPVPGWVRALVHQHGGNERDLSFIMTKPITSSDMNRGQNRLLIPSRCVNANLIPMLDDAEKDAANLNPSTSRVQGREHRGLPVFVYTRSGFCCHLILTRWDATKYIVIKGREYKILLNRSFLRENDEVEMWGFRQGSQLCFVLGKREQ